MESEPYSTQASAIELIFLLADYIGCASIPSLRGGSCFPCGRDKLTTTLVNSPLYPVMVKKARETMKNTAEGAGIDWEAEVDKLRYVCLSVCLPACLPACLSVCLYVCILQHCLRSHHCSCQLAAERIF